LELHPDQHGKIESETPDCDVQKEGVDLWVFPDLSEKVGLVYDHTGQGDPNCSDFD